MLLRAAQGYGMTKSWRPLEEISPHSGARRDRRRGARVLPSSRVRLGRRSRRPGSAIDAAAAGWSAPARSRCRPRKTCSCGPAATGCARGSKPGSRSGSNWPGASGGLSRSISTSSNGAPAFTAPRPPREHYFDKPAAELSRREAARLAAVLPDPLDRSASSPGPGRAPACGLHPGRDAAGAGARLRCPAAVTER